MAERCSHVQCSAPATARVAFDSLACFVWIDPYEAAGPRDVGARGAGALCTRHADRLVPPRGWAVQDRRSREPRLWADRPAKDPTATPAPSRRVASPPEPATTAVIDAPLPFDAPPAHTTRPARTATSTHATPPARTAPSAVASSAPVTSAPAEAVGPATADADADVDPARGDIDALLARPTSRLLSRAFDHARGGHVG